jgi:PST family polysaccharide transporter
MNNKDLDRSLVTGIGWMAASRWSAQALSWVAQLYAARALHPRDYGIVSMAMIPVGLLRLVEDFGIDAVLVQNRDLSEDRIRRLGGFVLLVGVGGMALLSFGSPLAATYFDEPMLPPIVAWASLLILFDALQVVPRAMLQRQLRFRALAGVHVVQVAVTSIALVSVAYSGHGYFALLFNNISGALAATILLFTLSPTWFRWPGALGELSVPLLQGWRMLVSRMAWYACANVDSTAVGRSLGKDALGNYQLALTFSTVAVQDLSGLITRVAPGIFSATQKDLPALRRYFLLLTEGLTCLAFPVCAGIALTADVLVLATIGPTWGGVVGPLRGLCMYSALIVSQVLVSQVLVWTGQFRANMWLNVLSLIVTPLVAFTGARYSTTAVAWALVAGWAPAALPGIFIALRTMKMPWGDYLRSLRPALVGCLLMSIVVLSVRGVLTPGLPPIVSLGIQALCGAATYCAVLALLFRDRIRALYELIRAARTGQGVPSAAGAPSATDVLPVPGQDPVRGGPAT